jgi:two-component system, OmpR family, alkaline phosphatase synthesis response regulator PhoP
MNKRILLIEDDKAIGRLMQGNLQYEGFDVEWCETGGQAEEKVRQFSPHLVLLDLMLPTGVDGLEICRSLTESRERTPVIILTAKDQQADKVRGLMAGADDYVTKPFAFDELLARIHAVLRRTTARLDELRLGETVIDFRRLRAFTGTQALILTDKEFEILRYLAERAGKIVSRDELLHLVWGYESPPVTRTVDNFIFRLRQKIERDPRHPQFIHTVYGDGYRLTIPT